MKIRCICAEQSDHPILYNLTLEVIAELRLSNISVSLIYFEEALQEDFKLDADTNMVFEILSERDYRYSIEILKRTTQQQIVPFLYFANIEGYFSWDPIFQLNPLEFLLTPSTAILKESIRSFLTRISKGLTNDFKYVWVSLKKGAYQKLDIHSIKYIKAENHAIEICCDQNSLPLINTSLQGFYERYLKHRENFYYLNRSCVINLAKVSKIENNHLFIDLDRPLSIPRGKKEEVLNHVGL